MISLLLLMLLYFALKELIRHPSPVQCCMQALKFRKHDVQPTSWSAIVQGILVDPSDNMLTGVSDPRKDGAPAGY